MMHKFTKLSAAAILLLSLLFDGIVINSIRGCGGGPPPSICANNQPTPAAMPTFSTAGNLQTVSQGGTVQGVHCYGDSVTDDTPCIQAAVNAGDISVTAPGTYAIYGSITVPTGRSISCQAGSAFLDTECLNTKMFKIGYSNASSGNVIINGCTFEGTDTAANYSTYCGGNSVYSELLEIASGWGVHTANVLVENSHFLDAQGDSILTYSPCGTNNTGAPCNNGAPGTEGPTNVSVLSSTFAHCAQPGIHFNGGQNLVAQNNTSTDCGGDDEADSNVLQVMTSWWMQNTWNGDATGSLDALNGQIVAPDHSCSGDDLIAENDSGCYSCSETINGDGTSGSSVLREPPQGGSGCNASFVPGHYYNETLTNGATLSTGC